MLNCLQVKDFAIITSSSLDLLSGMTTLTGETGAGKSILLGALGLVLGDRATPRAVREGADRAEITAVFDVDEQGDASAWLADHSLDQDGECILRRVVTRDGKSRAFINGNAVTVRSIRELGQLLVNIHGQHDHQLITHPETQLQILDDFGKCANQLKAVRESYDNWHRVNHELESIQARIQTRADRQDSLRFQLLEFASLPVESIDFAQIDGEHRRLANASELREMAARMSALLQDDETSALGLLAAAEGIAGELSAADKSCAELGDLLASGRIQLEEASEWIRQYSHSIEPDPERLQQLDEILALAHKLGKKHRVDPSELNVLQQNLQTEYDQLQGMDESLETLQKDRDEALAQYRDVAAKLSAKRKKAATTLARHLTRSMQSLGMKNGKFEIALGPGRSDNPSIHGNDAVVFKVSANPGAAPLPMSDVASGGELSRLSLAVQLIRSERNRVPTLIFDEVDTGVGGGVAETVGKQLRQLGSRCQVLCVTHLPQVAAQGHHHIKVTKHASDKKTLAESHVLSEEESLEEIARMLGGVKITKRTREHAREMLADAALADAEP
jgi:DNA repair protein RecN (Recombination protein N)